MKKKLLRIGIAVLLCVLIGFLSSIATQTSISTWYVALEKPTFTPPNWLFAPVWTILYILMGIAAGIVWSKGFYHKWVKTALYHFGFQLLLNAAWSIFFFGMRNPLIALVDIIALFILLLFTIKWFKVVNSTAAYLLIPYLIWVAFATALNFSIWQLN
ncbi:tryptophan-rich sensory protein [Aquimarina sp. BL5]|uniref:TspO/MBR family protein n=1 Tax=Aquimarina sp. BL5 TaxID=1714860 RepID=UPI000E4E16DE|nr:TspO/MBR family protein [Aquimarina sp. BL5]AXT52432.1 tryptophan-rich sensory protein [Aquimarina sp. BL5]RKN05900.1 tryptophan-rich sensory protein [Aquimarina sp. BL5]